MDKGKKILFIHYVPERRQNAICGKATLPYESAWTVEYVTCPECKAKLAQS